MSKRDCVQERGNHALEFKLKAVRMLKGGQAVPVMARILGVLIQTLGSWVRLSGKGQLEGLSGVTLVRPPSAMQRLRPLTAEAANHGVEHIPVIAAPSLPKREGPVCGCLLTYADPMGVDRRRQSGQRLFLPAVNRAETHQRRSGRSGERSLCCKSGRPIWMVESGRYAA